MTVQEGAFACEKIYERDVCTEYDRASILDASDADRYRCFFGLALHGKMELWQLYFCDLHFAWCGGRTFFDVEISDLRSCRIGAA